MCEIHLYRLINIGCSAYLLQRGVCVVFYVIRVRGVLVLESVDGWLKNEFSAVAYGGMCGVSARCVGVAGRPGVGG